MSNIRAIKDKKVFIELDKKRQVRFDLNAYAELEIKYGSVAEAMAKLQEGSIRSIRSLLWAGLIHECIDEKTEEYTLTEKQVGAMISIEDLDKVTEAITAAMTETMPDEQDADEASNEGN